MPKNLVIVESPAKAKTIEGFLGKDFIVKSSFGHVRDLAKNSISIDIEKDFEPKYEIDEDKKKVISELKSLAKGAEMVWLATDEDREGEAISWHLAETLNLTAKNTKRIVFHEITKDAILKAIENPRGVNINLVDAQQARRVLDRLVGFEISPILWKKVKPALSAGRVQSVAVRLIVEREREIQNFKSKSYYRTTASFIADVDGKPANIKAELDRKFDKKEDVLDFLNSCLKAAYKVDKTETKPSKKTPAPPFTTSTLQQEASRKLGFSVARTMMIAQQLYESGKITYMRTDSVNLSDTAINAAREEIKSVYGDQYYKLRKYVTKSKGAQEAHEAIRPTYIDKHTIDGDAPQQKLYELIWKRTIASQMSDAVLEKTDITIGISSNTEKFIARGEVIKFDGFLKVYLESTDDDDDERTDILPPVKVNDMLNAQVIEALQKYTLHPARYTEASLVKKLEELGIGRPSTYAPIISTVQKRGYVVNESKPGEERLLEYFKLEKEKIVEKTKTEKTGAEKSKIFPTDIGVVVNDFLVEYFGQVLDYNFTANVEKEFDEIAAGHRLWKEMIRDFYGKFHENVESTGKNAKKASGERLLGIDPKSGKNVYTKIGRYGALVQIGETDDEEKPKFAGLLKGQSIDKITLAEALELFSFPKNIGEYEGQEVIVSVGKFGPYVRHAGVFYSIPKTDNPLSVSLERAIEIIEEKKKNKSAAIKEFPENAEVKVLNGKWGPYISIGKNNYKIPKTFVPADLTLEQCLQIAKEGGDKSKGSTRTAKKNKTTKK